MKRSGLGGIAVLALVLTSCGSTHTTPTASATTSSSPSSTTTPAPTPTPTPLADCATPPAGGTPAAWGFGVIKGSEVEVVGTDGTVLNTAPRGGYGSTAPVEVGVGQAGVYFYDESTGDLSVLGKSGPAQVLGDVTPAGGWNTVDNISLAESPSGACWAFAVASYDASQVATSQIYVGGTGIPPTLVTTLTRPNMVNGAAAGGYQVLRWDATGVLLGSYPTGVGGAGPFIDESYSFAIVVRLDPATGTVSAALCSSGQFADEATDGSIACLSGLGSDAKIAVTKPGGATTTVDTGSDSAGEVAFLGGTSAELTYCTAATVSSPTYYWIENLLAVQLGSSPTTLIQGNTTGGLEGPYAWFKLVGGTSIAEIQGASGSTELVEVNFNTGQTTTLAPADSLLGVL